MELSFVQVGSGSSAHHGDFHGVFLGIPTFPWWFWKDHGSSSPKRPEELQVEDF